MVSGASSALVLVVSIAACGGGSDVYVSGPVPDGVCEALAVKRTVSPYQPLNLAQALSGLADGSMPGEPAVVRIWVDPRFVSEVDTIVAELVQIDDIVVIDILDQAETSADFQQFFDSDLAHSLSVDEMPAKIIVAAANDVSLDGVHGRTDSDRRIYNVSDNRLTPRGVVDAEGVASLFFSRELDDLTSAGDAQLVEAARNLRDFDLADELTLSDVEPARTRATVVTNAAKQCGIDVVGPNH
jgi:hypothetical protein